jgi:ATP-binding cassette, subfamily C, bacterial
MIFGNVIGRPQAAGLALVGLLTFILNLLALILPVYMLQVYDRVLQSSSLPTLFYLTLIAIGGLAVLGVVEGVRQVAVQRVSARLEVDVGERLVTSSLRAGSSDAPRLLGELAQARAFLGSPVFTALLDMPFAPIFLIIVFLIHPALGALVVVGIAVLLVLTGMNQSALRQPQRDAAAAAAGANMVAWAIARNSESIRAMGMHASVVDRWGRATADALVAQDKATRANAGFAGLSRFVRLVVQIGILGLGAYLALKQEITAGMIFATSLVAARALAPVDNLVAGWKSLWQALNGLRNVDNAIATTRDAVPRTRLAAPLGHLAFEKVTFVPEGAAEPTIKGVSLVVQPGEAICLLGPSGAGKSTFARLAAGALTPSHGTVRLDGSDIENWEPIERGRFVGYLPQDVEFLPASIAANIARLDPAAADADIIAASDLAGVTELVKRLPKGFDTRIGPGGLPLSGGQRQRIALARAVFGLPRLVVLDEPNAHLDSDGEGALNRTIAKLKHAGATVVVVSQRAGVLKAVDRVLAFRDGQIVGSQSSDEVLSRLPPAPQRQAEPMIRPAPAPREARA